MVLTRVQARNFYDRFGKKHNLQAFYENAVLEDLVAHADFDLAEKVFELGCGTGRFAIWLLNKHLSPSASYLGIDLSRTMINIAEQRVLPYKDRAKVSQSGGSISFPIPDHSVDRVVSTYVLDLLSKKDIRKVFYEAYRVLIPGGKLCLVSLTNGVTLTSRTVCALWTAVFRFNALLVGGCRPIQLDSFFDQQSWTVNYRKVVTQYSVPSEVIIISKKLRKRRVQIEGAYKTRQLRCLHKI